MKYKFQRKNITEQDNDSKNLDKMSSKVKVYTLLTRTLNLSFIHCMQVCLYVCVYMYVRCMYLSMFVCYLYSRRNSYNSVVIMEALELSFLKITFNICSKKSNKLIYV